MRRWLVYNSKTGAKAGYILAKTHQEATNFLVKQKKWISVKVVWQNRVFGFSDQWIVEEIGTKAIEAKTITDLVVSRHIYWSFELHTGSRVVSTSQDNTLKKVTDFGGVLLGNVEHLNQLPTATRPALLRKKEDRHWYWTGWVFDDGKKKSFEVRNLVTDKVGWVSSGNIQMQKTLLETIFGKIQGVLLQTDKIFETVVQAGQAVVQSAKETLQETGDGIKKGFETIKIIGIAAGIILLLSKMKND